MQPFFENIRQKDGKKDLDSVGCDERKDAESESGQESHFFAALAVDENEPGRSGSVAKKKPNEEPDNA